MVDHRAMKIWKIKNYEKTNKNYETYCSMFHAVCFMYPVSRWCCFGEHSYKRGSSLHADLSVAGCVDEREKCLCRFLIGVSSEILPTAVLNVILNCWQHTVPYEKHLICTGVCQWALSVPFYLIMSLKFHCAVILYYLVLLYLLCFCQTSNHPLRSD